MRSTGWASDSEPATTLQALSVGASAVVVGLLGARGDRHARLAALGVTPGALVRVLQKYPGFVFECDQTELAVEPAVAREILVEAR